MGRTNPTYRDALRAAEKRWADFRRALRRRDRPRFDRLFAYAREHADAGGLLNHRNPLLPALFGIALEQETRLDEHGDRIAALDERIDVLDERIGAHDPRDESLGDRLDALDRRIRDLEERLDAPGEGSDGRTARGCDPDP